MAKGHPSPPKYVIPDDIKNEVRNLIDQIMEENGVKAAGLAKKLEEEYGRSASYRNILNKYKRASFSLAEYLQILKAYGYDLKTKKVDRTLEVNQ